MLAEELDEQDALKTRWLILFVLLSLLAHALIISTIVLISHYVPSPKFEIPPPPANPTVTISLAPAPAPPVQKPKPFMPTPPDANAKPQPQAVISDNDSTLRTQNKTPRDPNSIMPDVTGKDHANDLVNSPNVPQKQQPPGPQSPPTPKISQPQPESLQPPTPKVEQPQPKKSPPVQTTAKTQTENPNKGPANNPQPAKPAVDPNTGLPVLPPLNVQTMAQQNPALASQSTAPPPVLPAIATSVHGALGTQSDTASPAAMATALGKYKAKFYRAVGSHWYPMVDQHFQTLPVGVVRIQFTIHSTGLIETKVIDGGNGSLDMLRDISLLSIQQTSPFDPFPPAMIKELGGADSFTDEFSFSVYGN